MSHLDISNSVFDEISYDKIDPLLGEKPFYISDKNKAYQGLQKKEKKFPIIHIVIFAFFIPIVAFVMGMIYIGGIWNPIKNVPDLEYVIVNQDKGCIAPICEKMGLNSTFNMGSFYQQLDGKGGHFTMVNGNRDSAIKMIEDHEYWVALYIPEDFTIKVLQNLNEVSSLNNNTVVPVETEFIYDEVRNYTTMRFVLKAFEIMKVAFFNSLVKKFDDKGGFNPLFLIDGIIYKENNLHAVTSFGQNYSSFIFLLIAWIGTISTSIISHFYFPFENHWVEKKDAKKPILKTMLIKIVFCISLNIFVDTIVSIIPFFCSGSYVIQQGYFKFLAFIVFFALSGLGVNYLLIHILPFIIYYLVVVTILFFQLLSCNGIVDLIVQPKIFNIGKYLPMYYGVRETKYLFWGSGKQYRSKNFLVISIWASVLISFSLLLYYLELRAKRRRALKRNNNNYINITVTVTGSENK